MTESLFARLVFPVPFDREFHYRIPDLLAGTVRPGMRLSAPFGKQGVVSGWCVGLSESVDPGIGEVKEIASVLDDLPLVDETILRLTRFIADEYFCSWGEALNAAVPAGVRERRKEKTIARVFPVVDPRELDRLADERGIRGEKQRRLIALLRDAPEGIARPELLEKADASSASLTALIREGLVRIEEVAATEEATISRSEQTAPLLLTPAQSQALAATEETLAAGAFGVLLLHGVTGSGKTEVYIRAIERVVAAGRQAIVLVPEISLTPQTVGRFRGRFERVAVLHSRLGEAERRRHWREIREGNVDVVVGARSAIFAPTKSLGIVVVDEEHETSYKQENTPRYHVREVALERARLEKAAVILGTATPSLESYYCAQKGIYRLCELPERVEKRAMPSIDVVDMAAERAEVKYFPLISRQLKSHIETAIKKEEQVILFLNRRGYTTYIACRRCDWVLRCARCDISMTFHKSKGAALCHHCLESKAPPTGCPSCGAREVSHFGVGTERIEEEVHKILPDLAVERMDSDTMKRRGSYDKAFEGLWEGATDVLIGTQMIAKGLDIQRVTLVGVISADTAFHIPDFRSAERTFQLVTQVAGRAGRGPKGGRVIVQSFNPDHYSIRCAQAYDYRGFVEKELAARRQLDYPPFSRLVRILVQGKADEKVRTTAAEIAERLRSALDANAGKVVGPVLAPLARIRGDLRLQILIKALEWMPVRSVVKRLAARRRLPGGVQISVDADPVSVM
ncbi:MAG: primosomal protein N' [Planctomycetes bacterium RBG_16_59_8]|nr:MAG: primosomal protein N' [Planctomycetes bacterium RBG_16_59_8]